jgi:hypothetical protein
MQRQVHLPFRVLKHTQPRYFLRYHIRHGLGIAVRHAHKKHKTLSYLSYRRAVYPHFGSAASLYYYSHSL